MCVASQHCSSWNNGVCVYCPNQWRVLACACVCVPIPKGPVVEDDFRLSGLLVRSALCSRALMPVAVLLRLWQFVGAGWESCACLHLLHYASPRLWSFVAACHTNAASCLEGGPHLHPPSDMHLWALTCGPMAHTTTPSRLLLQGSPWPCCTTLVAYHVVPPTLPFPCYGSCIADTCLYSGQQHLGLVLCARCTMCTTDFLAPSFANLSASLYGSSMSPYECAKCTLPHLFCNAQYVSPVCPNALAYIFPMVIHPLCLYNWMFGCSVVC